MAIYGQVGEDQKRINAARDNLQTALHAATSITSDKMRGVMAALDDYIEAKISERRQY